MHHDARYWGLNAVYLVRFSGVIIWLIGNLCEACVSVPSYRWKWIYRVYSSGKRCGLHHCAHHPWHRNLAHIIAFLYIDPYTRRRQPPNRRQTEPIVLHTFMCASHSTTRSRPQFAHPRAHGACSQYQKTFPTPIDIWNCILLHDTIYNIV